jgi:DNA-binding transcriptional regulator YiaG
VTGSELVALIDRMNLSQRQFAILVGTSNMSVSRGCQREEARLARPLDMAIQIAKRDGRIPKKLS